jgi:hypothetical protein
MIKTTLYCLVCLAFLLGLAGTAVAIPPPGGWGHDCGNWITQSDPWASGWICYDPILGSGGDGWRYCSNGQPVAWPGLDIQLWVEMECALTWDYTKAQIHRFNDFNDFCLDFHGTSSCNNGQWIITTAPPGGRLDQMAFIDDVLGRGPTYGTPIPASWVYSVDGSGWAPPVQEDNDLMFEVGACDHAFAIRICFDMDYHQEDGYYELGGPNYFICPATPL